MCFNMVREAGLEPAWPLQPGDFKSPEYTNFSTLANLLILVPEVGIEPTTNGLSNRYSTTELLGLRKQWSGIRESNS